MAKSKMNDVYDDMIPKKQQQQKESTRSAEPFIRVNFFISKDQKRKLEQYTRQIAPPHIKISQSELVRYMIENFDPVKARENYFKF
jgi:hypothetical protein